MSSFMGGGPTGGFDCGFGADDKRTMASAYSQDFHMTPFHATNGETYRSPWWPRSALDASGGEMVGDMLGSNFWELPAFNTGAVSKVVFTGVSRDANGSILPSATMKLFKTADGAFGLGGKDKFLDEVVSDSISGAFSLMSNWYPDTHYIVLYKTGTPDVQGTTVNTLIGA